MAQPRRFLTIPTALETANVVILGQISLVYSDILFQAFRLATDGSPPNLSASQMFLTSVVLIVPFVLIINITSSWLSTREAAVEFDGYPNALVAVDVALLIVMFMLNNAVTFSILPGGNSNSLAELLYPNTVTLQANGSSVMTSIIVRTLPPMLYLFSGVICVLYIIWNRLHHNERQKRTQVFTGEGMAWHQSFLGLAVLIHLCLLLASLLRPNLAVEAICLSLWTVMWLWLNGQWILVSPLRLRRTLTVTTAGDQA